MARIFITGSVDGLGQLAANALVRQGHQVVLHARNPERAEHGWAKVPGAEAVLVADLSSMEETTDLASQVNNLGVFDSIIHNAGLYQVPEKQLTRDALPLLLAVNSLAPYILTCLISKPKRLVYLSSGMHKQANASLAGLDANNPQVSYSDSKFHNLLLAMAVARQWSDVWANAVDPGWVPTKMGGPGAPDNLEKGFQTQVWLASGKDEHAQVSGQYFHHKRQSRYLRQADDASVQQKFIAFCEALTGIRFPKQI